MLDECDLAEKVPCISNRHVFLTKTSYFSTTPSTFQLITVSSKSTILNRLSPTSTQSVNLKFTDSFFTTSSPSPLRNRESPNFKSTTLNPLTSTPSVNVNNSVSKFQSQSAVASKKPKALGSGTCDQEGELLIDGLDCSKFYKCIQGSLYSHHCPNGMR